MAVETELGKARVDEIVGFDSARGKVGESKTGGTLVLIMRLKAGVEISPFNCLGRSPTIDGCRRRPNDSRRKTGAGLL